MLQRAFADDRITEFIPQTDKALIGARTYRGEVALVVKLAYRKYYERLHPYAAFPLRRSQPGGL